MFGKNNQKTENNGGGSFLAASVYYILANVIGQGVVLLSSGVFTRMMSKYDYGLVSTYSTWVLVLNAFIGLNLFITVRNAYIDYEEKYDEFVSSVLLLSLLSGIGFTVAAVLLQSFVLRTELSAVEVLLACVQAISLHTINLKMAVLSMRNQYGQRSMLIAAPNCTHTVLSIVLMLVFTQNLYLSKIAGNAFGFLIFALVCVVGIFAKRKPTINKEYWGYAVAIAVPSVFHTLSDLLLMQCDRLMLTGMISPTETAEYSLIYNVGAILVAIYQAINGAWVPWFYKRAAENDCESTGKYQEYYLLVFTVMTLGMTAIAPEVIKILSPSNYWGGIRYVGLIIISSYLIYLFVFFTTYLIYEKRTGAVAKNTIIAAVTNIILNYYLIPHYLSFGAAIATVISYVLLFILHFRSIGEEGRKYFCIDKMLITLALVLASNVICYFTMDMWVVRYLLFVVSFGILCIKYAPILLAELKTMRR